MADTTSESAPHRPPRGTRTWWIRTSRKWHRWVGAVAGLFLIFVSITGVLVAFTEFFGEEEQIREATRGLPSPMHADALGTEWQAPIAAALATVDADTPGAPIDKITIEFKGEAPRVMVFTGFPEGGEDRKFVVDQHTGDLRAIEDYADKPFLTRLHSGEAFGDGGLVVAMFWGLALLGMSCSGLWIYLSMRRKEREGWGRFFW